MFSVLDMLRTDGANWENSGYMYCWPERFRPQKEGLRPVLFRPLGSWRRDKVTRWKCSREISDWGSLSRGGR